MTQSWLTRGSRPLASPTIEVPAGDVILVRSPLEEEYRRLCGIGAGASERGARLSRPRVSVDVLRLESARHAVLLRSDGHCESPSCTGEPQDITDAGHPILEVDHIQDLAKGGPDYPEQMIALCPNCHAIKTRGPTRERLSHELFTVARQRHDAILSRWENMAHWHLSGGCALGLPVRRRRLSRGAILDTFAWEVRHRRGAAGCPGAAGGRSTAG